MDNDSDTLSAPEVRVLLFGQLGVQLGLDEIEKQDPLLRGEITFLFIDYRANRARHTTLFLCGCKVELNFFTSIRTCALP